MSVPLKNDRFIRSLLRQPVDRTPVWIMRQAGRYLPEYRATRTRAGNFLTLCKTPELACEVTLQPIARFDLDAAILFSDILTIPDAMGLGLSVEEGEGPRLATPVRNHRDIARLGVPDPETDLGYVMDAIRLVRHELDGRIPLIGFAGSPWTLATYMVEGRGSKDFSLIKTLIFDQPESAQHLLETITEAVIAYLSAQAAAGAQALMVFDTWGGALSRRDYERFSLHYMRKIISGLDKALNGNRPPVILFTKGGGQWLESIAGTGCDAVGLDWTTDIDDARQRIGKTAALQGNMDPNMLYASPDRITREVATILDLFGAGSGHVFNLGHGIHPGIDPGNVRTLVDAVHELSRPYHR
jgi:uroporphyrinogen decarboxylase